MPIMDQKSKPALLSAVNTTTPSQKASRHHLQIRRVRPDFDKVSEPLWFRGDRFRTDFYNAYAMLLADEYEFVRIIRPFLLEVGAGDLHAQLKAWLIQESLHGVQHTKAHAYLDRTGIRFRAYQRLMRFVYYRVIAPALGARLMLGMIAGLEHFNTLLGEMCLRSPDYFRNTDSEMNLLLRWHFAEEIEHRAVIHDVTAALGMSYFTRVLTGIIAFFFYSTTLLVTAWWFAVQNGHVLRISTHRSALAFLFFEERFVDHVVRYLREYFRKNFHPLDKDIDQLSARVFEQLRTIN